jgi:hypothetical protein
LISLHVCLKGNENIDNLAKTAAFQDIWNCSATEMETTDFSGVSPWTVVMESEMYIVFYCMNTGIMDSNPTQVMNLCLFFFCIFIVLSRRGLAMG